MPPTTAHLNGSINLPDVETVMREVLTRMPNALRRLPDGEPGERGGWIHYQFGKFQQMDALVLEQPDADAATYTNPKLALRDGVDPRSIRWPDLGYADSYRESFEIYSRLESEGILSPGLRFQVEYPTPMASIMGFIAARDRARLLPSYERALFEDLDALLSDVPYDLLAVQWDVAVEIGMLEAPQYLELEEHHDFDWIIHSVARCIDAVPNDVPAGAHLCYGDYGHKHFMEPESLATQVRVINELTTHTRRFVDFFSITVPQQVRDEAFFAPLADLAVDDETELYLALVPYHPSEQADGTTDEQVRVIDHHLGGREWGICTECGMGRVEREDVLPMLDAHREILARFAPSAV